MIKVKLRTKKISGNRESFYLDFYPAIPHPKTGEQTRREFLGLYIYASIKFLKRKNKDGTFKQIPVYDNNSIQNSIKERHNEETRFTAEQICQKRQNILNKPEIYTEFEKEQLKTKKHGELSFLKYFEELANKRKNSSRILWMSVVHILERYTKGNLPFKDVTEKFCNEFREFLLTLPNKRNKEIPIAQNSAWCYFSKLKSALKQAFKDGYLHTDLSIKTESIKQVETQFTYLTIEELNKLVHTECENLLLRKAALFSALTGLRFCDIKKLTWGELFYSQEEGYGIKFIQKKTSGVEVLPISEQAYNLLGKRKEPTYKIFDELKYSVNMNHQLFKWIVNAGITNKIVKFHAFRHTYGVQQLIEGTDIYTLSKMFGHRELKSTQRYAHVVNKTKRIAANKIVLDFK